MRRAREAERSAAARRLDVDARIGRVVPGAAPSAGRPSEAEPALSDDDPALAAAGGDALAGSALDGGADTDVPAGADPVPAGAPTRPEWQEALAETGGRTPGHLAREAGIRQPTPGEWGARLTQRFVADYKPFNFVDGEGVRCSLYVSGCPFRCPGCYNKAAQSFRYGTPYTRELEDRIMADLAQPYVQGLTLLGGEPFLNTDVALALVGRLRQEFGHTKDVWAWSGYTFEQLLVEPAEKRALLEACDVLVDGPFVQALFDTNLAFRGSSNQRIIDVPASLAAGAVRLWKNGEYR